MLEEEVASGSTEGESEEGSSWSGESEADEEENEDEEEDEPVLKYRRFAAKEVVMDIAQTAGREFSLICCIAVHPKVCACVFTAQAPPTTASGLRLDTPSILYNRVHVLV